MKKVTTYIDHMLEQNYSNHNILYRKQLQLHIFTHILYDCFTQKTLVNMFEFSHLTHSVNNYNFGARNNKKKKKTTPKQRMNAWKNILLISSLHIWNG